MGVAGQGQHESVAQIEIGEGQGDRVVTALRGDRVPAVRQHTRIRTKGKNSALLIVVKIVDSGAPVLAAEFEGVAAVHPGEVVQDLVALAGSAARDAEPSRTQILNRNREIKLGQAKLSIAKIQAQAGGIKTSVQ